MSVKCESCGQKSNRQICQRCLHAALGIKVKIGTKGDAGARTMGHSSRLPDLDYYDNVSGQ
jgi:hypothetical protein